MPSLSDVSTTTSHAAKTVSMSPRQPRNTITRSPSGGPASQLDRAARPRLRPRTARRDVDRDVHRHVDEPLGPFHLREPADEADDRYRRAEPEPRRAVARIGAVPERDPGWDHALLLARPIPAATRLSRTCEPTATSAVVRRRGAVRPSTTARVFAARSIRAAGDRGMVDRGRCRVGPRREPSEHAGLGLVRVHDVGPELRITWATSAKACASSRRSSAAQPATAAPEVGSAERHVVAFVGFDRSRRGAVDRSVAGSRPSLNTVVWSAGSADVQPIDDAQHADVVLLRQLLVHHDGLRDHRVERRTLRARSRPGSPDSARLSGASCEIASASSERRHRMGSTTTR